MNLICVQKKTSCVQFLMRFLPRYQILFLRRMTSCLQSQVEFAIRRENLWQFVENANSHRYYLDHVLLQYYLEWKLSSAAFEKSIQKPLLWEMIL